MEVKKTIPRVPPVDYDALSPEQQRVYKEVAGTRHVVGGPYTVWLRTPEIADVFNKVGDVLRVHGKLEKRLQELMVLILAREWNCQYQWTVHESDARSKGIADDVIEAIRYGRRPAFQREDEQVVYNVVTELIATRKLSDATYQRAIDVLGMDLLIELVTNSGRYTQSAMVINAFQVPVPGDAHPLPDLSPGEDASQKAEPPAEGAKRDPHVRRIVTGHDKDGKSIVWIDGYATNHKYPNKRMISTLLWCTDGAPADWSKDEDYGSRILGTAPPPNGTRFMDSELMPGQVEEGGWPHMHRTDSIDCKVVISGEVTLYLDDSKVVCKPGDVVISRGTNHAWVNEGSVPCRSATVLIDAVPKRSDSVSGATTQRL